MKSLPGHHCQLLECLMALKPGVVKDILCVAAYGTGPARASAAKLLFYYWPSFNPNLFDRRTVLVKIASEYRNRKVCVYVLIFYVFIQKIFLDTCRLFYGLYNNHKIFYDN